MRAILIDDESPALRYLASLLEADSRFRVTGCYLSASQALEHLVREPVEVAFLDIDMPAMNGLTAAEKIHEIDDSVMIVYVTAHKHYAIEAFELHALDYLLKPIAPDRLAKTLDRIARQAAMNRSASPAAAGQPSRLAVRMFRRMELVHDRHGVVPVKWRTEKAQELFAYLICQRGDWVPRDTVLEAVWPDYPLEKSTNALHMSVYQIRKLLKEADFAATVEFSLGSYRMSAPDLSTDVATFEAAAQAAENLGDERWEQAESALALYRGQLLEEHDYAWAIPLRRRMQNACQTMMTRMAQFELRTGRGAGAIRRLSRLQEMEPYAGDICRLLLEAYAAIGDGNGLRAHYSAYVRLLANELGIEPDPATRACYERLAADVQ